MIARKQNDAKAEIHLNRLLERYPELSYLKDEIKAACRIMEASFASGGKLLVCGNGGSAADADHIVGELMKGFYKKRSLPAEEASKLGEYARYLQGALPAIALTQHAALSTAFLNDVNPEMVFAQQVYGYGRDGDVLLGISTSGNSKNVCNAVGVAKSLGLKTIGLTGRKGGRLSELCDVCIRVPADSTADIQELHLPIYHTLCAMLEELFFD